MFTKLLKVTELILELMLINFSLIVKQAIFADVNHAWIRSSWDQPVLSNEGKVYCSRKQRGPLIGLELTTDRHPPIMNQTCYPLRHAAPFKTLTGGEMPITLPETQMIMKYKKCACVCSRVNARELYLLLYSIAITAHLLSTLNIVNCILITSREEMV